MCLKLELCTKTQFEKQHNAVNRFFPSNRPAPAFAPLFNKRASNYSVSETLSEPYQKKHVLLLINACTRVALQAVRGALYRAELVIFSQDPQLSAMRSLAMVCCQLGCISLFSGLVRSCWPLCCIQAICKTISNRIWWRISAFWLPQLSRTQAVYFGSVLDWVFLKLIWALELYVWFAPIGTDCLSHLWKPVDSTVFPTALSLDKVPVSGCTLCIYYGH